MNTNKLWIIICFEISFARDQFITLLVNWTTNEHHCSFDIEIARWHNLAQ